MISHVRGRVSAKFLSSIIIDVGGLGFEVYATPKDIDQVNQSDSITMHTYFAVRENSQELYGFLSSESKSLFELLLGVSGVGPKVALSIMNLGDPSEIKSAIAGSNAAFIQSASGVGKRGAEKVIVELKDKVGLVSSGGDLSFGANNQDDAHEAMVALGYSPQQASQALSEVDSSLSVEDRIKQALKNMSK